MCLLRDGVDNKGNSVQAHTMIGIVGVNYYDQIYREANFGYLVKEEFRSMGYASEAVQAYVDGYWRVQLPRESTPSLYLREFES